MDSLSHGLWAIALVKGIFKKGNLLLAFVFGLIPDALPLIVSFFQIFVFKTTPLIENNSINFFSAYSLTFYYILHSFVIIFLVFLIIYIIKRKIYIWMLGWPLHVLMDIAFHSKGTYGTRILYPISNFHINGIEWWTNPIISIINWVLLIAVLIFLFRKKIFKLINQTL